LRILSGFPEFPRKSYCLKTGFDSDEVRKAGDTIQMAQRSTLITRSAAVAALVSSARDTKAILPVSMHLQGEYGLQDIAVNPARIGKAGAEEIISVQMNPEDKRASRLRRTSCASLARCRSSTMVHRLRRGALHLRPALGLKRYSLTGFKPAQTEGEQMPRRKVSIIGAGNVEQLPHTTLRKSHRRYRNGGYVRAYSGQGSDFRTPMRRYDVSIRGTGDFRSIK
jgi:hypothetical protein